MSKQNIISATIASLFSRSEKTISEKLSTEEFNQFAQDAADLDAKLNDPATAKLANDLKVANEQIAELNGKLAEASTTETKLNTQVAELTKERNTYKEQHEKAAEAGKGKAKEDENSRDTPKVASYNAHALEAFNRANPK